VAVLLNTEQQIDAGQTILITMPVISVVIGRLKIPNWLIGLTCSAAHNADSCSIQAKSRGVAEKPWCGHHRRSASAMTARQWAKIPAAAGLSKLKHFAAMSCGIPGSTALIRSMLSEPRSCNDQLAY
jgi:hypothetical protein